MKSDIHPTYFPQAKIVCVCGAVHVAGSTQEKINVEICANCHPFYTGKQKIIDSARRVEKFQERHAKKATLVARGGKKIRQSKRIARKVAKKA